MVKVRSGAIKKRYLLSKKERKNLVSQMESMGFDIRECRKENIEVLEYEDRSLAYVCRPRGVCVALRIKEKIYPCLRKLVNDKFHPHILVDRGATNALLRGADLMAPGVKSVEDEFHEGDVIVIGDLETRVPIAIGVSLISAGELRKLIESSGKGKVVKVIHHVGDKYWVTAA
ncbi:MAG: DUF1947 domain-containing protein [Desulfurococcales archaeon]|nr:DUF1947 domain-containing protein [Desulfurococcales archaeon]